jgi:hypothetical protein
VHPALGDAVREILADYSDHIQPLVTASSLGTEAQLTGAIFRAIEIAELDALAPNHGRSVDISIE